MNCQNVYLFQILNVKIFLPFVPSTGTHIIGASKMIYLGYNARKPVDCAIQTQYQIIQNTLPLGYLDIVDVKNYDLRKADNFLIDTCHLVD